MNIDEILGGKLPTLGEYAEFVGVSERLPIELLYKMLTNFPDMHWVIRNVVNEQLKEKVRQANRDRFNEHLLKNLTNKLI